MQSHCINSIAAHKGHWECSILRCKTKIMLPQAPGKIPRNVSRKFARLGSGSRFIIFEMAARAWLESARLVAMSGRHHPLLVKFPPSCFLSRQRQRPLVRFPSSRFLSHQCHYPLFKFPLSRSLLVNIIKCSNSNSFLHFLAFGLVTSPTSFPTSSLTLSSPPGSKPPVFLSLSS